MRGGFNNWEGGTVLQADDSEAGRYLADWEFEDDPGRLVEYKFVIVDALGTLKWESDVGDGRSNRAFELSDAPERLLPKAYFDNLDVDPGAGVEVTFQVDLAARIQDGTFDPAQDTVGVRGPFNDWGGEDLLEPVEPESSVYVGQVEVKHIITGTDVPYKYIINDAEWESGENRAFTLGENEQTLPLRYFNDVEPPVMAPLGTLRIGPSVEGMVTLSWDSPEAVLQGTADFEEGWDDIGAAAGEIEFRVRIDLARALFFRLAAPSPN